VFFFCVHDAAVTRGQYSALSKAWWCRYLCFCYWSTRGYVCPMGSQYSSAHFCKTSPNFYHKALFAWVVALFLTFCQFVAVMTNWPMTMLQLQHVFPT